MIARRTVVKASVISIRPKEIVENTLVASKILCSLVSTFMITACGGPSTDESVSDTGYSADGTSFIYRDISADDIERVRNGWASRDLSVRAIEVLEQDAIEGQIVRIVTHEVLGRPHYGAIAMPVAEDYTDVPVNVIADGLDQDNPSIRIENILRVHLPPSSTAGFIKVIPAFRGRTLRYKEISLYAEGDFCDAYDGAADDAIAMLNVAQALYPEANFSRVLVSGGSRGGNTALLMAVRDGRINTVISGAAPVDFYREELRTKYSDQYVCQFFGGRSESESRERMLASSPVYFAPNDGLQNVFLFHGGQDDVVPPWNSLDIAAHLESYGIDVVASIYPDADHSNWFLDPSFGADVEAGITAFLNSAESD